MRANNPGCAVSFLLTGLVTNMARNIEVLIRRCRRPILSVNVVVAGFLHCRVEMFVGTVYALVPDVTSTR
jgi:hypothetical protein